jgi:hypothetical protein
MVQAHHNLAGALQQAGDIAAAMQHYAEAWALDAASFARIAQDLATGCNGAVWLTAAGLKSTLQASLSAKDSGQRA